MIHNGARPRNPSAPCPDPGAGTGNIVVSAQSGPDSTEELPGVVQFVEKTVSRVVRGGGLVLSPDLDGQIQDR